MALRFITLDALAAHCVADGDYVDGLEEKGEAAEFGAEASMNRNLYASNGDLAAARAGVSALLAAASSEYDTAKSDAAGNADLLAVAEHQYREARHQAFRILHGMVVNPQITGAILMHAAHLWANRADVVEGNPQRVPQNSEWVYQKYRMVEGTYSWA